jgi:hypothetical protein
VIFDSGALPALAAGACMPWDIVVATSATSGGNNFSIWYGASVSTAGGLASYVSTQPGPFHMQGEVCNLAGSQTSQAVYNSATTPGGYNPDFYVGAMSQTTTGATLHLIVTNATNNGSGVTTNTTPISFRISKGS